MTTTTDKTGLIPTAVLRPHIRQWMENYTSKQGEPEPDNIIVSATWVLAFRVWKTTNNVEKMRKIVNGKIEYIEFDLADKIICAMGDHTVWYGLGEPTHRVPDNENGFVFRDVYWKVSLHRGHKLGPKTRCLREGCSNQFRNTSGKRRFCSEKCYQAWRYRIRNAAKSLEKRRMDTCPVGHDRSEENIRWVKSGTTGKMTMRCRLCHNARIREYKYRKGLRKRPD